MAGPSSALSASSIIRVCGMVEVLELHSVPQSQLNTCSIKSSACSRSIVVSIIGYSLCCVCDVVSCCFGVVVIKSLTNAG